MANFRIEDAAFSGVNLLVRKPFAALTWAGVYLVFLAFAVVPFAGAIVSLFTTMAKSPPGAPNQAEMMAAVNNLQGFNQLMWLGSLVVNAVISSAVFRAILRPDDSAFAYLRLGSEELWVLLVQFVNGLLLVAIEFVLLIPFVIFAGISMALTHGAGSLPGVFVGALVVVVVMIWVSLRLSLAGPITFNERQFRLFESWTLTRGKSWRLLGVAAILVVIGLIIYFVAVFVGVIGGVAIWGGMPHPSDIQAVFNEPPARWAQTFAPFLVLIGALVFVGGTVMTPIALAPWPYIYKQLQPGVDVAATFS